MLLNTYVKGKYIINKNIKNRLNYHFLVPQFVSLVHFGPLIFC